jgi:WD40 repeat protein
VAFAPDGRRLASASHKTVRIWDAASGAELAILCGHEDGVNGVAFAPDGRRLASASRDGTVRVWDAASGAELRRHVHHLFDSVEAVAFAPDGRRLASVTGDRTVRVWDAASGAELAVLSGPGYPARGGQEAVEFTPDGRRLVAAWSEATVRVWDTESWACVEGRTPLDAQDAQMGSAGPWRAIADDFETVIESTSDRRPVAWFPVQLLQIKIHPSRFIWTGCAGKHLCLIKLEGQAGGDGAPRGAQGRRQAGRG